MSTLKLENIQHPDSSTPAIILDSTGAMSGAIPAGGRNRIINGGFDVWQRGTSFSNNASYGVDRWKHLSFGSSQFTISRQQSDLVGFRYHTRLQRNAGDSAMTLLAFSTALETSDVIPLQSKDVVLSFYARSGTDFSANYISFYMQNGTGTDQGPFSVHTGESTVLNGAATLTTSWQRFSATGTFLNNASSMRVEFDFQTTGTAGLNDYYEIAGVQLEESLAPTTFEHRSYEDELARCMRYYESGYFWEEGTNALSGNQYMIQIPFKVKKRANATISYGNVSGPNANINITGAEPGYVAEANGAQSNLYDGFMMRAVPTNSTSTIRQYWTASAEL